MKVLIVDDNEDSRIILKRTLESIGYTVEEASNGVEALKLAKESTPDMVISDILMPEKDGFMLCYEVKHDEDLKKIPFVFYTATYKDQRDEKLAIALGASHFIIKPVEPDEFLKIIKEVLQEYKEKKLPVPEEQLKEDIEIYRMYVDSLVKKLDKNIKDLEHELKAHHEIEEAFRTSEKRLSAVMDQAPDAFFIHNNQGQVVDVNKKACQSLGYTREELLSKTIADIDPEAIGKGKDKLWGKVIEGEAAVFESHHKHKDGDEFPVEITLGAIHLDHETLILGIAKDITKRKWGEKPLRESENKYRTLLEN